MPLLRLFLTVAALLLLEVQATDAGPALMINRRQVNIRADATVQSARLAVLRRGEEVEQLGQKDEWLQVRLADGRTGWVHSSLVQERLVVNGRGVRLRAAASTAAPAMASLPRGHEVGKLRQRGNWCEVVLASGKTGWISRTYVRPKSITMAPAATPVPSAPAPEPQRAAAAPTPPTDSVRAPAADESTTLRPNPYAEGLRLEQAGEYAAALELFEQVRQEDPDNLKALLHASLARMELRDYDRALEGLYAVLEQSGGRRDIYLHLGEIYRLAGATDSTLKYQALYRGERYVPPVPVDPLPTPQPAEPLVDPLWIYLAIGIAGALGVAGLVLLIARRRRRGDRAGGKRTRAATGRGKFERHLEESSELPSDEPIAGETDADLDGQIEGKWQELQQSSSAFLGEDRVAEEGDEVAEEAHLDHVLTHLETLRKALEMQDERARIYADIVRLQSMKIEVMEEQLQLQRRRK